MSAFTGIASISLPDRRILMNPDYSMGAHKTVVVDSAQTDTSGPRSSGTMLRPGNVLSYKAATGRYYTGDGGDAPAAAAVTALIAGDATWESETIKVYRDGQLVATVTTGGASATTAAVNTDLNNNAIFAANFIATSVGGKTVITDLLGGGADHTISVQSSVAGHFNAAANTNTSANGSDGDYVVLLGYCDLLDPTGNTAHAMAHVVRKGFFDDNNLINLTAGAKKCLRNRGSAFLTEGSAS